LKRGFPQKIGPQFPNAACQSQLDASVELPVAPSCKKTAEVLNRVRRITEAAAASVVQQSEADWVERLLKPVLADANCQRRARHSVAAVGFALSMGAPAVAGFGRGTEAYALDAAAVQSDLNGLSAPDLVSPDLAADVAAPEPIALGGVELSGSATAPAPTVIARASELAPLMENQSFTYHIVQVGETLSGIARAYGVSANAVMTLNDLPQASLLTTGQTLKVPFGSGSSAVAEAPAVTPSVKVASSQLPAESATSLDDTIARLRQQRQQLQGSLGTLKTEPFVAAPKTVEAPEPIVDLSNLSPYRVKPGDTLDTIARNYSLTRTELLSLNRLDNPNVLKVDQVIQLPKSAVAVAPIAATPAVSVPTPIAAVQSESAQASPESGELPQVAVSSIKGAATLRTSPVETAAPAPVTFRAGNATSLRAPKVKADGLTAVPAPALTAPAPVQVAAATPDRTVSPIPGSVYRVELGDTLAKISRSYGVSMQELLSANNISDANVIFVGQQLTIPGSSQVAGLPSPGEAIVAAAPDVAPTLPPRRSVTMQTVPSLSGIAAPAVQPTQASGVDVGYVDTLVSEIRQLRQRYQNQAAAPIAAAPVPVPAKLAVTAAPVAPRTQRINPEFKPQLATNVTPQAKPSNSLVASASLGSQTYEPLVQSLLGKTAAPELPGLSSDPYLPDGAMTGYIWPAKGQFTSGYGWRWGRMHKGIDIAADTGTPIYAAAGGVVTYSAWNDGGYGNLVEITHPDGTVTIYAHNSRLLVREGQRVRQGQQISEMGSTGFSTGPHLHFEIRQPGQGAVNPIALLPKQ
jgi:murein DD-endopeptidase MepM/ murein hydrolase activator NlpD